MVPAAPGGGWDITTRALQRSLLRGGVVRNVQVFNIPGAGGTVGLQRLAEGSDPSLLMMMGTVLLGSALTAG